MADLTLPVATFIATGLVTIGHPYHPAAIQATALDLIKWCKGAFINGRPWNPEQQAEALVDEARTTWDAWPETGGTKQLFALFHAKYAPKAEAQPELKPLSYQEAIAKGLINAPCEVCDERGYTGRAPNIEFCTCITGRNLGRWEGNRGLLRLNQQVPARPVPGFSTVEIFAPTRISPEQIARALDEDRRRRLENQDHLRLLEVD